MVGSFDTLGNDQNPETSVGLSTCLKALQLLEPASGLITTTATTTQQVQLELGVTLTTTATHTTSTSTIITTTLCLT